MKKSSRVITCLLCLICFHSAVQTAVAQDQPAFKAPDSLYVLKLEEYFQIVRTFHPVVRQANLVVDRARAELTAARAGFDPWLMASHEQKTFDGKNYYNWFHPEIRIPSWYGIEFRAGLENNTGDFLNSEETQGKSSYLGVTVPLARDLVMDRRRAVLQQAKVFREQSKAERTQVINDLLYDAGAAYWYWVKNYLVYRVLADAVQVSEARLRLTRIGYEQGDRPAIDTTEALAQVQSFILSRNDAFLEFRNAGLDLSNFLWRANDTPYYVPPNLVPDTVWLSRNLGEIAMPVLEELLRLAQENHPKLQTIDYKLQMLDIDKRLRFQDLLPVFNLKYNILNSGYNVFKDASWALYENNYKFGFDFGVPLRLSQGRGQYRIAKIKIEEMNLNLYQTRLAIDNKIRYQFNELAVLRNQIVVAEQNYQNYLRLFQGEDLRFRVGESSLFLINARENKVLESRQKLLELKTKFLNAFISVQWAAGLLR